MPQGARRRRGGGVRQGAWTISLPLVAALCGGALVAGGLAATGQARIWRAVAPAAKTRPCVNPKCKKPNKPGARFCAFCGAKQPAPVTEADRLAAAARRLLAAGEWAEAERVARGSLQKDPKHVAGRAALGCALAEQGDVDMARVELEAALRLQPNAGLAQVGFGVVYARQGRTDAAERALKRAALLDPKDQYAANRLRAFGDGTLVPPVSVVDAAGGEQPAGPEGGAPDGSPGGGATPAQPARPVEARNLLTNGDLDTVERRGRISDWSLRDGASSSKGGYSGEWCARIHKRGGYVLQEQKDALPGLIVGQAYRLSLCAKRESAEGSVEAWAEVVWTAENGAALATHRTDDFAPADTRWQPFSLPVAAPPEGAKGFQVRICVETATGPKAALLLDDLSLAADVAAGASAAAR